MIMMKAALFDLDGVVFDTEGQYSDFWGRQFRTYYPGSSGMEQRIKGQTLGQIFDAYFPDADVQERIVAELENFEQGMRFPYVDGFADFVADLRACGVRTAIVTSSNRQKMSVVYANCPELTDMFDAILTSEDFLFSKPHPDCYEKAAARLDAQRDECVVFEDSFNGLRSGRSAGMRVVGLSTTNVADDIKPLSDVVISDYLGLDYEKITTLLSVCR